MAVKIKVDMKGVGEKINRIKADEGLGRYLAEQAKKGMEPYVPYRIGKLCETATVKRPFHVTYPASYARYPFYGSGMNFRKDPHPLATHRWDKAYTAAHKGELARFGTEYLRRS